MKTKPTTTIATLLLGLGLTASAGDKHDAAAEKADPNPHRSLAENLTEDAKTGADKAHGHVTSVHNNPATDVTDTEKRTASKDRKHQVEGMDRETYTRHSEKELSAWQDKIKGMEARVDNPDGKDAKHADHVGNHVRKWQGYHEEMIQASDKDWETSREKIEKTRKKLHESKEEFSGSDKHHKQKDKEQG